MAIPFVTAAKAYFGLKEEQTLMQFAAEVKELNDKDRLELHGLLVAETGQDITPPTPKTPTA